VLNETSAPPRLLLLINPMVLGKGHSQIKRAFWIIIFCIGLNVWGDDFARIKDEEILALPSKESFVLMNFWATWCEPCRVEIPALNRLHKKYPSVVFVGINVDDPANRGAIKGFLKKYPIDYQIYLREGKDFEALAQQIDSEWKAGIPATFIYKNGKQVYAKLGQITDADLEKVLE
jgi:thiol-disulfide isomerase/thioredoxin